MRHFANEGHGAVPVAAQGQWRQGEENVQYSYGPGGIHAAFLGACGRSLLQAW
jgi:hypothetical protein